MRHCLNRLCIVKTASNQFVTGFDQGFYMLDLHHNIDGSSAATPDVCAKKQSLCAMKNGQRCRVCAVGSSGVMRRRLMDLGLVPDTEITLLRAAPLNDPIEIRVGNAFVSLRCVEAEKIEVVAL